MNKLIKNYEATVCTLERLIEELLKEEKLKWEFVAETDPKSYGSNEAQREAYLSTKFFRVEEFKKLIKQAQIRREYYKDVLRAVSEQ